MPIRYSKVPSRTKFNTEYMPWLEEDEIESNDPLEIERLTDNTDIIKEDVDRFRKLCRETGFNFSKLNKEYERKLKLAKPLKDKLADARHQLGCARLFHQSQAKQKRLEKEIRMLEKEIEKIMED